MYVQRIFRLNGANILCFVSWAIQANVSHTARTSSNTLPFSHSHVNCQTHSICVFSRAWQSFYDFYGNATQVRNIYGITIPSFIVDIKFTHWIATVCDVFFGLSVLSAAHLLRCNVRVVCIVVFMSCLAYVRQNTQPSNQLKYTVSLDSCVLWCRM